MRHAAPYAVDGGPPIVRHRDLPGRHRGWHETATQPGRRLGGALTMMLAVLAVPVAWWALLTGAGISPPARPAQPQLPGIEQPGPTRVVLPPIIVNSTGPAAVSPRPKPRLTTQAPRTRQPNPVPKLTVPSRSATPSCPNAAFTESRR